MASWHRITRVLRGHRVGLLVVAALVASGGVIGVSDSLAASGSVVSSVSPNSGPTGGGAAITITGSGFVTGDRVVIGQGNGAGAGAIAATGVSVVDSTQITATTGGGAKPGVW